MRANAIENCLKAIVEAYYDDNKDQLKNYMVKASIILDRENNTNASVIRELINGS